MTTKPTHDVIVMKNVLVPMCDGVQLAADVYRQARGGAFVGEKLLALLERTPYSKDNAERVEQNGLWYATGDPLWANAVIRVAVNTIHHDAAHPSHLTLPLLDA